MDELTAVFGAVGGLALFLFGMGHLSDGLRRAAGETLRRSLEKITKWSLVAMLIGAGVTCLIQSSSATTVMVVGLANAGLLSLRQALSVVLGANIGTTFTAWLVAGMSVFKITQYALPAVALGFALQVLGKKPRTKHLGRVFLGFGILFIGIDFMKEAFGSLTADPRVHDVLIAIGGQPILAVAAGMIITMLLQSSSASIAMIQALAFAGAFGTDWDTALRVAVPFILGDNIGTTITAQIAAARTNLVGRRAAMGHTLFNVIGVMLVLPLVYLGWYVAAVKWISPAGLNQGTIMLHIAISHSLFNTSAAFLVLPAVGWLERLVILVLPTRPKHLEQMPMTLERHLLETPLVAIDQTRKELLRMCRTARDAVDLAMTAVTNNDTVAAAKVARKEQTVDEFQDEITRYLIELSQRQLDPEIANELPVLLHTVNDIERMGDHALNIAEVAERKAEKNEKFSDEATGEMAALQAEIHQMFDEVLLAVEHSDRQAAGRALEHEGSINQMQIDYRRTHISRLTNGTCAVLAGVFFIDVVDNLEKIGDHLANVAQGVVGGLQWSAQLRDAVVEDGMGAYAAQAAAQDLKESTRQT